MSQAGYTPIQLYFSTTAAAVPVNTNLANGELAINITDEKLYFKNAAGVVKLLASNATSAPVLSFSAGTTGLTPNTATTGAVTLAGTLATTNGGTGLTSFTSGGVVYASSTSALATGSALTFDGLGLTTNYVIVNGSTVPINGIYSPATNSLGLSANSANALYINGSQQVGLGVVPSYKFQVQTAGTGGVVSLARFGVTGNGGSGRGTGILIGASGSTNSVDVAQIIGYQNTASATATSAALAFQVANSSATLTEVARFDNAGNLGLGVTPSAWTNSFGVIQGLGGWSISHNGTNSNSVDFLSNAYRSGGTNTYLYIATSSATRYQQAAGVHAWYTAASGTAGNAISFTQAMTLDASGNLGIGTSSPSAKLEVNNGNLVVGNSVQNNTIQASRTGPNASSILIGAYTNEPDIRWTYTGAGALRFSDATASVERFRIANTGAWGLSGANYGTSGQVLTSGGSGAAPTWTTVGGGSSQWTTSGSDIYYNTGNVGIGTTTPGGKLDVKGGAAVNNTIYLTNGNAGNYANIIQTRDSAGTLNSSISFSSLDNSILFNQGASSTERMRISSAGALLVGTTSVNGSRFTTYGTADDTSVYLQRNTGATTPSTYPVVIRGDSGGSNTASYAGLSIIGVNGVGNSSSMRVGCGVPSSYVYHDTTFVSMYGGGLWQNSTYHWSTNGTTTYFGADYNGCEFYNHTSDGQQAFTFYSAKSNFAASLIYARCVATTTNSTFNLFYGTNGNGTGQFAVRDSGNCVNTNNSYGSISDIKLKQDIVDASTQWDDIKNLRIRKFRWKSEVVENPNAKPYLGLIAQEAELVSPGLIEETNDYDEVEEESIGDDGKVALKEDGTPHKKRVRRELGTTTKTVKYSILYMKAIKALQEAMDRIEQLEARLDAANL